MIKINFKAFFTAFLIGVLCAGISSCEGNEEPVEAIINIADGQELQFGQEKVVSSDKQTLSIAFITNLDWTLKEVDANGNWCTPSIKAGGKGDNTISFSIYANEDSDDRTSTFIVTCGTVSKNIIITQKGNNTLLLSSSTFEVPFDGDVVDIEVSSNIEYSIELPAEYESWIHRVSTRSAVTTTHNYFKVDASEEYEKREAVLKVKSSLGEEEVHVFQVGGAVLVLSQNEYSVSAEGAEITIVVSSNCDYGVDFPECNWIHNKSSRGITTTNLTIGIDANVEFSSRKAEIVIYDKNSEKKETVAIVQKGEHGYVDLGLPSGTKWATCNIGAELPEEQGDYFSWGETVPKFFLEGMTTYYYKYYKQSERADSDGFTTTLQGYTKYVSKGSSHGYDGFYDNKSVLDPEDDAAYVNWGKRWHMPSKEEAEELASKCKWTSTSLNGQKGYKAEGPNGNYIFLPDYPHMGGYWTNCLKYDDQGYSMEWSSYTSEFYVSHDYRYYAFLIRAVYR